MFLQQHSLQRKYFYRISGFLTHFLSKLTNPTPIVPVKKMHLTTVQFNHIWLMARTQKQTVRRVQGMLRSSTY